LIVVNVDVDFGKDFHVGKDDADNDDGDVIHSYLIVSVE